MKAVLHIFAKNSESGNVKTRLAASIGKERALRVYEKLVAHTLSVTKELEFDKTLWYSDRIEGHDQWDKLKFKKALQCGSDLGARMHHAFEISISEGYGKAVLIGTDCYELTVDHLVDSFRMLDHADVVIGPAADGGYYLLGMNRFYPALFNNIDWSTQHVYSQTRAVCEHMVLGVADLPLLHDIDTKEDLDRYPDLSNMKLQ